MLPSGWRVSPATAMVNTQRIDRDSSLVRQCRVRDRFNLLAKSHLHGAITPVDAAAFSPECLSPVHALALAASRVPRVALGGCAALDPAYARRVLGICR